MKKAAAFLVRKTAKVPVLDFAYRLIYDAAFYFFRAVVFVVALGEACAFRKKSPFRRGFFAGDSDIDITVRTDFNVPQKEYRFLSFLSRFYPVFRLFFPFFEPYKSITVYHRNEEELAACLLGRDYKEYLIKKQEFSTSYIFLLDDQFFDCPEKYLLTHFLYEGPSRGGYLRSRVEVVEKYRRYCNRKIEEFLRKEKWAGNSCALEFSSKFLGLQKRLEKDDFFSGRWEEDIALLFEEALRVKSECLRFLFGKTGIAVDFMQEERALNMDDQTGEYSRLRAFREKCKNELPGIKEVFLYKVNFSDFWALNFIVGSSGEAGRFLKALDLLLKREKLKEYFARYNKIKVDTFDSLAASIVFGGEESPFFYEHLLANNLKINPPQEIAGLCEKQKLFKCAARFFPWLTNHMRLSYFNACQAEKRLLVTAELLELLAIRHWLEYNETIVDLNELKKRYARKDSFYQKVFASEVPFSKESYVYLVQRLLPEIGRLLKEKIRLTDEYRKGKVLLEQVSPY